MSIEDRKCNVREHVWSQLRQVALPDSRHHFNFAEFITDFHGSSLAIERLQQIPSYRSAKTVFIAPDNCLEHLRVVALQEGKQVLMTTYAIRRGFWLLDPAQIPSSLFTLAATLDGMERLARPVKLVEMIEENLVVDFLVTGTGAINLDGVRFGKGHGFFDCEFGILYALKRIAETTPVAIVAHDCQVLDQDFERAAFDTSCDFIVTPTRLITISDAQKPTAGILWSQLIPEMLESIPPLRELREMQQKASNSIA